MIDIKKMEAALRGGLLPIVRVAGEDVRGAMDARQAHYGCPGIGVAVMDDGAVAWQGGFGVMEAGKPDPVDAGTTFAGASISKPVTSALVMQQVERGRLDLDVDVNRYLTAWRVPENEFTRQQPVTLRHLMSHRAGTTVHGFGGFPPHLPKPTILDTLYGRPPALNPPVVVDKVPGGTIRYSGGGTTVLQLVLEELTGKTYAELARDEIFEPLGMHSSSFADPLPPHIAAHAATGHGNDGKPLPQRLNYCPQAAAGGIFTTAGDYAMFMSACRNAYIGRPTPLMRPETARTMIDARRDGDFALGWRVLGSGASMRITHGGSNDGFQCETTCYLESGRGGVVLTNALSGAMFYWEVLNTLAEFCEWPGFLRAPKVIRPMDAEERARFLGRYQIVSGVDAPHIDITERDGQLYSYIEGMRAPPLPALIDTDGRMFNRFTPFETEVHYDANGWPEEIVAYDGGTEILRARHQRPENPAHG